MKRDLRFYLLIVGIPVLLVAIGGLRLLFVEVMRARNAEAQSLQAIAEGSAKAFARRALEKGDVLLARVSSLSDETAFRAFIDEDPLVSMAFRWEEGKGLVWPRMDSSDTNEVSFCHRTAILLQANAEWKPQRKNQDPRGPFAYGWQSVPGIHQSRVLGWIRVSSNEVRGVEIRRGDLLEALIKHVNFMGVNRPDVSTPHATVVAVTDYLGQEVHRPAVPVRRQMFGRASLGPLLPDWTLRIYWREGDWRLAGDLRVGIAIGMSLLILLLSSLVGTAMILVRDARRAHQESLQKTSFVSTVSHEFKTPLTTIRMCADLLTNGDLPAATRNRAAHTIVEEVNRLSRIVSNVLDYARLEHGRTDYLPEDLELASFVRDIAESVPNFKFVLDIAPELMVSASRLGLRGICVNLFENEVKYAGVSNPVEIDACALSNGLVSLRVMDRGPGMTKEEMARAFDRFWRADSSITRETDGTGLGLCIARGIARDMGGDLIVSPREGGGCVFTLNLPEAKSTSGEGDTNNG